MDIVQIFCRSSLLEEKGVTTSSSSFHWHSHSCITSSSVVQAVATTKTGEKFEWMGWNPTWASAQPPLPWERRLLIIRELFICKGWVRDSLQEIQRNMFEVCLLGVPFLVNSSSLSFVSFLFRTWIELERDCEDAEGKNSLLRNLCTLYMQVYDRIHCSHQMKPQVHQRVEDWKCGKCCEHLLFQNRCIFVSLFVEQNNLITDRPLALSKQHSIAVVSW